MYTILLLKNSAIRWKYLLPWHHTITQSLTVSYTFQLGRCQSGSNKRTAGTMSEHIKISLQMAVQKAPGIFTVVRCCRASVTRLDLRSLPTCSVLLWLKHLADECVWQVTTHMAHNLGNAHPATKTTDFANYWISKNKNKSLTFPCLLIFLVLLGRSVDYHINFGDN